MPFSCSSLALTAEIFSASLPAIQLQKTYLPHKHALIVISIRRTLPQDYGLVARTRWYMRPVQDCDDENRGILVFSEGDEDLSTRAGAKIGRICFRNERASFH